MATRIRHQITLVDGTDGGWSVLVNTSLFDDTLNVDEDDHVYTGWTWSVTMTDALVAARTMCRVGSSEIAARRP